MNIAEIDSNLRLETSLSEPDIVWADAATAPVRLYGAAARSDGPYRRLPVEVAQRVNPGVAWLYRHTAGIRLRFATDSPYLALKAEWGDKGGGLEQMSHMALSGSAGFDLYAVRNGQQRFAGAALPPVNAADGFEWLFRLPAGQWEYILNFPLYNGVERLYLGVKAGSRLAPGEETYRAVPPVVFYGSSITQGGCAARPGNAYEARLSRLLNVDFINLGFSGNARGETAMAEYIRALPMSVFVCDYDHNAVSPAALRETHHAFYETVRQAQPTVPYVMVSRPNRTEDLDTRRRLAVIAESYAAGIAAGDQNLYLVAGNGFFPGDTADDCTVDGCHPTDLGFYFMAQGLAPLLERLLAAAESG